MIKILSEKQISKKISQRNNKIFMPKITKLKQNVDNKIWLRQFGKAKAYPTNIVNLKKGNKNTKSIPQIHFAVHSQYKLECLNVISKIKLPNLYDLF